MLAVNAVVRSSKYTWIRYNQPRKHAYALLKAKKVSGLWQITPKSHSLKKVSLIRYLKLQIPDSIFSIVFLEKEGENAVFTLL